MDDPRYDEALGVTVTEPDLENLRRWVEAMRSGRYSQARRQLRRGPHAFCCLGVACDISGLGHWGKDDASDDAYYIEGRDYGADFSLPREVQEWLGVEDEEVSLDRGDLALEPYLDRLPESGDSVTLAALNDNGFSFHEIADIIERKWLS